MVFTKKEYTIAQKIRNTTIIVHLISIICVQIAFFGGISLTTRKNLKYRAIHTTKETVQFLKEPLYNIDDSQVIKIGETLLLSGFINKVKIESTVSGIVFDSGWDYDLNSFYQQIEPIEYNDLLLGKVYLSYSSIELQNFLWFLSFFSVVVLLVVLGTSYLVYHFFVSKRVSQPISILLKGLNHIAEGNYDNRFYSTGFKDLNKLARGINDMSNKIQKKQDELVEVNNSLEKRVNERTTELQKTLENLRYTQDKLINSAKMSALGYIASGIAHDLNSPVAAIIASNKEISNFIYTLYNEDLQFIHNLDSEGKQLFFEALNIITIKPTTDVNISRSQLETQLEWEEIPNSKEIATCLSKIGITSLSSDFLYLLKHPQNKKIINIIYNFSSIAKMIDIIAQSSEKAASVVSALRTYLIPESQESLTVVNLSESINRILTLMKNSFSNNIELKKEFEEVSIIASPDELGQIWMNLIRNSLEAMGDKGTLTIKIYSTNEYAIVEFEDTGCGISKEAQEHIFEPFYTTKTAEYTGIGLDLCKNLVEKNDGVITFEVNPKTTLFIIKFALTKKTNDSNVLI